MKLIPVDKTNYKEAIETQRSVFPHEDGTLNILASLDRSLFQKITGFSYPDDHVKYYLAEVDYKHIGITGLYYYGFAPESAWLAWYGVLEEYRGQGFGKELLAETQALASFKGFKYMRLYTDVAENRTAVKLYEKAGFVGEKYTAEKLAYDCWIYSKSLDGSIVPKWNNRKLDLEYQSELDQMNSAQIQEIIKAYDSVL